MEQTKDHMKKGGAFLIEEVTADQMFTPEDFTDEHKMIAKTTEDYILGDVLPYIDEIEEHNFDHSVRLLKKAGELGLLGADVPEEYGGLGLDKISSALITEKFSRAGSFSLSYGAHVGIGTLPIVFFRNRGAKEKVSAVPCNGGKVCSLCFNRAGLRV